MEFDVNLLAILVAAIINMGVGFLWYSPYLFATRWMKETGIRMGEGKGGMAQGLIIGSIAALVMAYVLAVVLGTFRAENIMDALRIALFMWLGFVATVMTGIVSWEMKSWTLYAINAGYWLVSLLLMGAAIVLIS